jgi:hypothetical protein
MMLYLGFFSRIASPGDEVSLPIHVCQKRTHTSFEEPGLVREFRIRGSNKAKLDALVEFGLAVELLNRGSTAFIAEKCQTYALALADITRVFFDELGQDCADIQNAVDLSNLCKDECFVTSAACLH